MTSIQFSAPTGVQLEVSEEKRTIRGLALPWNAEATFEGRTYTFPRGSVFYDTENLSRIKIFSNHDYARPIGVVTAFEDTDEGLHLTARIARGAAGDEFLMQAEDGVVDGLSVGFSADSVFANKNGVMVGKRANIFEVSTTAVPAFSGSRLTSIAASVAQSESNITMDNVETPAVEETSAVSLSASDVRGIVADVLAEKATELKPVVPAGRNDGHAQFSVNEESMYRFEGGISGKHDFSSDIIAGVHGDREALNRAVTFMNENMLAPKFVDTTDTAAVNPTNYRADMFKDEGPAQPTPLHSFFYKGSLKDVTPFSYSQLDAYSDLLDDHVEGVNPTGGSFAVETGATVTPSAVSGKIFITREVSDQQGNPAISGLVWSKFQRSFNQMMESKTATLLAGGTYTSLTGTIANGADGDVVGAAVESGLVNLQFLADGTRYEKIFGHVDLYKALAVAEDTNGRKLYPIINPANANGSTDLRFGHINVAGMVIDPTWSLGGTTADASGSAKANSYAADRQAIHVWNTGLTKLERLNEDVAGYEIGAWAYWAGIRYDSSGIKKIEYGV